MRGTIQKIDNSEIFRTTVESSSVIQIKVYAILAIKNYWMFKIKSLNLVGVDQNVLVAF